MNWYADVDNVATFVPLYARVGTVIPDTVSVALVISALIPDGMVSEYFDASAPDKVNPVMVMSF